MSSPAAALAALAAPLSTPNRRNKGERSGLQPLGSWFTLTTSVSRCCKSQLAAGGGKRASGRASERASVAQPFTYTMQESALVPHVVCHRSTWCLFVTRESTEAGCLPPQGGRFGPYKCVVSAGERYKSSRIRFHRTDETFSELRKIGLHKKLEGRKSYLLIGKAVSREKERSRKRK